MTKTEAADMDELGLTPEMLAEKQAHVAAITGTAGSGEVTTLHPAGPAPASLPGMQTTRTSSINAAPKQVEQQEVAETLTENSPGVVRSASVIVKGPLAATERPPAPEGYFYNAQGKLRKHRNDFGKKKAPKPSKPIYPTNVLPMVEISLHVPVEHARRISFLLAEDNDLLGYAQSIQDEVIDHLSKEIDRLRLRAK